MGPGVERPGPPGMDRHRDGSEDENGDRHDQHPEGGEFHFPGLYLFPQILRRSSNHQSADKDGDDGEEKNRVQPAPHPAGTDLTEHHASHVCESAHRSVRVVSRVDAARRGLGGRDVVEGRGGVTEASFLTLHVAGWLVAQSRRCYGGVGLVLRDSANREPRSENDHHYGEHGRALADVANHFSKYIRECDRNAQDERHRQEVREARRILERHGAIRVEESAAIRAELLDCLLRGDGSAGNRLTHTV